MQPAFRRRTLSLCDYLLGILKDPKFPLPPLRLVFITLDGANRHYFQLIEDSFKADGGVGNAICIWCITHMLNLWLQAFEDVDGIDTLFAEMEELVQYIRNHDKPRAILASFASKGLVRSVPTRFASKFLVMFRVIEPRPALAQCVPSPQWGEYEKGLKGACLCAGRRYDGDGRGPLTGHVCAQVRQ